MDELYNTLEVLKKLNLYKENKIYEKNEIKEEEENILEMEEIYVRLKEVLKSLNEIPKYNDDVIIEQLIELHLVYSDFIWQYDQMHEMIKKIIKLYR